MPFQRAVTKPGLVGPMRATKLPVWARAREYTDECLQVLAGLMRHADSEMVRKSAADSLLDRAWGKAPMIVMGDGDGERRINLAIMTSEQTAGLESALMALLGESLASDPTRRASLANPSPILDLPASDADKQET